MRGIGLTHAFADISGLAFDRLFMVTETDGTFITARQFPQMVKFIPAPLHDGLHLTAPDGSSAWCVLVISPRRPSDRSLGQPFYRPHRARRR
ncbi:Flavodoxin reductases (ferredoxin-NADPH reductases) family 1 [Klebsiella pneumoniae IS43]|uniref:Flavodoxin reductases (Ferredoxin-NADPH reductases) family 1 n=1 Tax=Klebsiella pneumoniae IS43 TaxID=1432552 RepID=W1DN06_KLEPN|nr:Flavodoxin reductases (ferredoxin-NADPH reductases) family 1 [Klebsiella pneumoniae IS43]